MRRRTVNKLKRRRRVSKLNMWGSTEEFNRNKAKHEAALSGYAQKRRTQELSVSGGIPMLMLEVKRDQRNARERGSPASQDPWTIDCIRPICQGGAYVYENCRLLRRSKNISQAYRTEEEIEYLRLYKKYRSDDPDYNNDPDE